MNPLILKKIASHYGSPWTAKDDDYVVLDAGKVIGRIMLNQHAPPGHLWLWTITARGVIATDARGYATTREEAMADFKARWLIWARDPPLDNVRSGSKAEIPP